MPSVKRNADGSARASSGDARDLLRRYRRRPTIKMRDALIELHRPTVEAIARTLVARLPRSVDVNDLVHAGIWGLMQALESFDPRRGIEFVHFMRRRVRGAMLDELRNLDYLPRLYRQLHRERESALSVLRSRLDRDPSDAEIAAEIGVTESRLRRIPSNVQALESLSSGEPLSTHLERGRGLDRGRGITGVDSIQDDGIESPIEALDRQDLLEKIEASLQPIEWQVLRMHYLEGVPGKEIARQLRLSASRICQIHVRVLSRLKARLGGDQN